MLAGTVTVALPTPELARLVQAEPPHAIISDAKFQTVEPFEVHTAVSVTVTALVPDCMIPAKPMSPTLTLAGVAGLTFEAEPELNASGPTPTNIAAVVVLALKETVSVIGGLALVGVQPTAGGVPAVSCPDARTVYPAEVSSAIMAA